MPGILTFRGTQVAFLELAEFLRRGGTVESFAADHGIDPQAVSSAIEETGAKPDNGTLALAFFDAARAEAVERLGTRENTFTFWIATVGVILGLAVKTPGAPVDAVWLSLIPILGAPFTFLIIRHSLMLNWLSAYVRTQLNDHLRQPREDKDPLAGPRHWDNSHTFRERIKVYLWFETGAYFVLLFLPALAVDGWMYFWPGYRWNSAWFDLCVGCTALTLAGFVVLHLQSREPRSIHAV